MKIDLYAWLILSALASYRLARLLVIDDGPFDMFVSFRGWAYAKDNFLLHGIGGALYCMHCAGLYISILFTLGYFFQNIIFIGFLLAFAVAGLQSLLSALALWLGKAS